MTLCSSCSSLPHREKNDLHHTMHISLLEVGSRPILCRQVNIRSCGSACGLCPAPQALVGFSKTIKHLDGHDVRVASEKIVEHGTSLGVVSIAACLLRSTLFDHPSALASLQVT